MIYFAVVGTILIYLGKHFMNLTISDLSFQKSYIENVWDPDLSTDISGTFWNIHVSEMNWDSPTYSIFRDQTAIIMPIIGWIIILTFWALVITSYLR